MYKFLLRGFLTSTFTSRFIVFSKFENILSFQIAMSVNPFLLESCTNTVESLLSSTHLADLKKIGNKFLDYKKHKNKSPCSQESRFPNEQSNVELGNRGGTRSIAVYHIAQNPPPSLKITRFSSHRVGFSNSTAHVVHRGGPALVERPCTNVCLSLYYKRLSCPSFSRLTDDNHKKLVIESSVVTAFCHCFLTESLVCIELFVRISLVFTTHSQKMISNPTIITILISTIVPSREINIDKYNSSFFVVKIVHTVRK